ncbi:MAG: hypothetical protein K2J10_02805 [Muribaculaceae bacterium]|nr:hypothetical protein [Muribaculaceae bacterium]
MYNRLLAAVMSLMMVNIAAHADEAADYKKFAQETRDWVYALDLPAFNVREIPDKYKDESAVYIAVYNNLSIQRFSNDKRISMRYSRDKCVEQGMLERTLVYINDKAALDEFSEYDFLAAATHKYGASQNKHRVVMGVKVIKPDGTETEIDTEDYVEVKEDKKGKQMRQKLAVPGLEVGDIIDVFVYTNAEIYNDHPDPMIFILREDYPVMNFGLHWLIDANLAATYRLLNGAPEFAGVLDGAQTYHLDMELVDLPARPRLFYDDMTQSPAVKLYVFNPDAEPLTPKSSSMVGHCGEPFSFWVRKEMWNYKVRYDYEGMAKELLKSSLKNGGKAPGILRKALKSGEKSLTEVADCAYNLMVFAKVMSDERVSSLEFDICLQQLLRDIVGDSLKAVMTTPSNVERLDRVLTIFGITTGSALPDGSRYYFPPKSFMAPSELHPAYTGRVAQQYPVTDLKDINEQVDTVYFNLPDYPARENRKLHDVKVTFDGTDLKVKRQTTCKGIAKLPVMPLLSSENIINAYLDYFNSWGLDIGLKENGKKTADRLARNADSRAEQMDDFESEAKSYNRDVSVDSVKGEIISVGIDPQSPKLTYGVEYTAHDLVKRAGKNLLLSVGKLVEDHNELRERDRQRDDFIVSRGAREYITHVEVELPEGMKVSEKSLESLNSPVSNSAGMFGTTARFDDGKLIIDVIYRFGRRFLPASSWPDVVAIMDAANEWESKTILLER